MSSILKKQFEIETKEIQLSDKINLSSLEKYNDNFSYDKDSKIYNVKTKDNELKFIISEKKEKSLEIPNGLSIFNKIIDLNEDLDNQ